MRTKEYDIAVVIGRFQPFHKGHMELLKAASNIAKNIIVLVGSVNKTKTNKNPFTYEEVKQMIPKVVDNTPVYIFAIKDYDSDRRWIDEVAKIVYHAADFMYVRNPKICVVGHQKDDSSYYLATLPFDLVKVDNYKNISGTDIRKQLLVDNIIPNELLPESSIEFLRNWLKKHKYIYVNKNEIKDIESFRSTDNVADVPDMYRVVVYIEKRHFTKLKQFIDSLNEL